jgi:transposase
MVKKAKLPGDKPRLINGRTARQMLSLRHAALRHRLHHVANVMGKEFVNEGEQYTTIACAKCLRVNDKFSGTTFACKFCGYTAPRDAKSGLTLAVKCLDEGWRAHCRA